MADLEELAGRVEGLTGPDRTTDLQIDLALKPDDWLGLLPDASNLGHPVEWMTDDELPRYTASIDAAMTLIEAESWIEIKGPRKYLNIPTPVPNKWSASVAQWNHEGEGIGWGATPALALTAAALRALSRTQGNQNG